MSTHEDLPYLKHVLDAINDIENSIQGLSKAEFQKNKDVKDASIRRLEVIGEAVKNISDHLKRKYPEVAWKKVAGARDIMIHAYFRVDLDIVWDILKRELPKLKQQIIKIRDDEDKNN